MAALLSVANLNLERGGRSLFRDFSLSIERGELVQLAGENGTGKTTLLRYLAGLSSHSGAGELVRSECSQLYLGHKPAVKTLLSPRENLQWYCQGFGFSEEKIDSALELVGLYGYEEVASRTLSAGQLRRVALARVFLGDADLYLLDEPFTSIDARGVALLSAHLSERVNAGAAVVCTSHQPIPVDIPLRRVELGESV